MGDGRVMVVVVGPWAHLLGRMIAFETDGLISRTREGTFIVFIGAESHTRRPRGCRCSHEVAAPSLYTLMRMSHSPRSLWGGYTYRGCEGGNVGRGVREGGDTRDRPRKEGGVE